MRATSYTRDDLLGMDLAPEVRFVAEINHRRALEAAYAISDDLEAKLQAAESDYSSLLEWLRSDEAVEVLLHELLTADYTTDRKRASGLRHALLSHIEQRKEGA